MKILTMVRKDLARAIRRPFGLLMMFGAPFLITGLLYFAFGSLGGDGGMSMQPVEMQIVNQDEPAQGVALGEMLIEFLQGEDLQDLLVITEVDEPQAARQAVNQGQAGMALIVPADFSATALSTAGGAGITLVQDPTLSIGPAIVRDLVNHFLEGFTGAKVAAQVVLQQMASEGLDSDPSQAQQIAQAYAAWLDSDDYHGQETVGLRVENPSGAAPEDLDSKAMIAGIMLGMMIFFVFFIGANSAESIIREDEEGTLARLFTTPTSRNAILASKFLYVFLTLVLQITVVLVASALLFNIRWGEPLLVVAAAFGLVVAASGFGVCLMSLIQNTRQTGPVMGGVLTLAGMIGGLFTTGVPNIPKAFEMVNLSMPHGWALRAFRQVYQGAATGQVMVSIFALLGMGLMLFTVGAFIFRRRFG